MIVGRTAYSNVLGMTLYLEGPAAVEDRLARIYRERFRLWDAVLEGAKEWRFIAAIPQGNYQPTILSSKGLRSAVQRAGESAPVAICFKRIDPGLKRGLVSENIPFNSEDGNAYLPFIGIQEAVSSVLAAPRPLSPQAQRIALNLTAGRWVNVTASELAKLCSKSRASITKYLREIEAINPALLNTSWRSRILGDADLSRAELLGVFEPYLVSPVAARYRFASVPKMDVLAACNTRLSGLSALSFFSDLTHDPSHLTVMMGGAGLSTLRGMLGETLREAAWYDDAPFVVEEWAYPLDATSDVSVASFGLASVDPWSLYAAFVHESPEDVRVKDAVEQLKERLCR